MDIVIGNAYTIEGTLEVKDDVMTVTVSHDSNISFDDIISAFNEHNTGYIYIIDSDDNLTKYYRYIIIEQTAEIDGSLVVTLRKGTVEECIDHIYELCNSVMWVTRDSLGSVSASVNQNDRLMLSSILSSITNN